jgi:hypothetical protein
MPEFPAEGREGGEQRKQHQRAGRVQAGTGRK